MGRGCNQYVGNVSKHFLLYNIGWMWSRTKSVLRVKRDKSRMATDGGWTERLIFGPLAGQSSNVNLVVSGLTWWEE